MSNDLELYADWKVYGKTAGIGFTRDKHWKNKCNIIKEYKNLTRSQVMHKLTEDGITNYRLEKVAKSS